VKPKSANLKAIKPVMKETLLKSGVYRSNINGERKKTSVSQ
jgi:hypothetical protein